MGEVLIILGIIIGTITFAIGIISSICFVLETDSILLKVLAMVITLIIAIILILVGLNLGVEINF